MPVLGCKHRLASSDDQFYLLRTLLLQLVNILAVSFRANRKTLLRNPHSLRGLVRNCVPSLLAAETASFGW